MLNRNRTQPDGLNPPNGRVSTPSRLDQARLKEREPVDNTYRDLRKRVQVKLIAELDPRMDLSDTQPVRRPIQ